MTPYERASIEATRRVEVLPAELADWIDAAEANVDGAGIHRSQLFALRDLMATLTARQRTLLGARPKAAGTKAYADAELEFTAEVVGAYELWIAFRSVLDQRRDEDLRPLLDAADLVSADAYRTAMGRAVGWGVVADGQFREPPLVCAEAVGSPLTAARGQDVSGLSGTIKRFQGKLLPIPMVLFPIDRLGDLWSLSTLVHEVGHDLDADLAFGDEAIQTGIAALEAAGVPSDRQDRWQAWGAEVVADAVGIALGGAGFATNLSDWLLAIGPASLYREDGDDPHPPPHVRVVALAAMLRAAGVAAWADLADDLEDAAATPKAPAWQTDYLADAAAFSGSVLTTALGALDDHRILDLGPDPADEAARTARLSTFLRTGFDRSPTPDGPPAFPVRLVPSAAALAAHASTTAKQLDDIVVRGMAYLEDIPRPAFLAAPPVGRREFLRGLAERLDVRPPAPEHRKDT